MNGEEIKKLMHKKLIPQWRLANELNVSENTVHRWLRCKLPEEKEKEILAAITRIEKAES